MKSLLIIGAGGYGRLVKEIAELAGYDKIDFLDDNSPSAIGKLEELESLEPLFDGTIVAIGNPELRETIFRRIKNPVTLHHPFSCVSSSAAIGKGCVLEANTVISAEVNVKDGTFICAGAIVNHNSEVGPFCQVDCNAVVAMGAVVPKGTKVVSCSVFSRQ